MLFIQETSKYVINDNITDTVTDENVYGIKTLRILHGLAKLICKFVEFQVKVMV